MNTPDAIADSFSRSVLRQAQEGGYALLDAAALCALLDEGGVTLVDVRDAGDFEAGHIPGAICYPLPMSWHARFFRRWWLKKLLCRTACVRVVFCCGGTESLRSDSAARAAVISGIAAVYRYVGGLEAWRKQGLPVETGPCCEPGDTPEEA